MATTYWDYTIKYGSTTKSTNTNTGLTSVVIKYGSTTKATITSATTKTLATSGKYCNQNISIGAKTLATSGKYCNQNISVTTSAKYKWTKYNSVYTYSQATQNYNAGYDNALWRGSTTPVYGYTGRSGSANIAFNTSNGQYTLTPTNGSLQQVSMKYNSSSGQGLFYKDSMTVLTTASLSVSQPVTGDNYVTWVSGATDSSRYGLVNYFNSGDSRICVLEDGSRYAGATVQKHYQTGGYSRGGTNYGNVWAAASNTYPSNGRHSDGYWYVIA